MSKKAVIKSIAGIIDYALMEGIEVACNDNTFHDVSDNLDPSDIKHLKVDAQVIVDELIKNPEFLKYFKTNVASIMSELDYALRERHGIEQEEDVEE